MIRKVFWDDEGADEHGDAGENEQSDLEKAEAFVDLRRLLVLLDLACDGLEVGCEDRSDPLRQFLRRHPALGPDVDPRELVAKAEEALRLRQFERGERGPEQRVLVAEAEDADKLELLGAAEVDHRDHLADCEVVELRRVGVDGYLSGAAGAGGRCPRRCEWD